MTAIGVDTRRVAHMSSPPYNREDAEMLRASGRQIVACFECLVQQQIYAYWPYETAEFSGAMIYCKQHFAELRLPVPPPP